MSGIAELAVLGLGAFVAWLGSKSVGSPSPGTQAMACIGGASAMYLMATEIQTKNSNKTILRDLTTGSLVAGLGVAATLVAKKY